MNLLQICSTGQSELTGAGESRGSPPLSGHNRLMQQPELVKTGRPTAAAAMELERENSGERRKTSGWRFNGPGYL